MQKRYIVFLFVLILQIAAGRTSKAGIQRDIAHIKLIGLFEELPGLIIADSYLPMTHFDENDVRFSVSLAYLRLPLGEMEDENYRDNFTCKSVSPGIGWAITDRLFISSLYSHETSSGTLGYDEDGSPLVRLKGNHQIQSYMGYFGYDLWNSDETSIPLMFGYGRVTIKVDMDVAGIWYPADFVAKADTGYNYYFFGIAYSEKYSFGNVGLKITPYIYYLYGGKPEFEYSSNSDPTFNHSDGGLQFQPIIDGVYITIFKDNFSASLSMNGVYSNYYYNSYDNIIMDGLHMAYLGFKELSMTLTITYTI